MHLDCVYHTESEHIFLLQLGYAFTSKTYCKTYEDGLYGEEIFLKQCIRPIKMPSSCRYVVLILP